MYDFRLVTNRIKFQSVDKIRQFFYFIFPTVVLPVDLNQTKKLNIMKTTLKQLAAATFIVLIAMAISINTDASTTKLINANNTETTLELEDWMTNETIWNASEMAFYTSETDAELEIENWMTNHRTWHTHSRVYFETELALEMENWMTDETTWTVNETMTEEQLTVEDWMTDSKIWE